MSMRELRVEDALLYLDQVKVEFGDRPHIYNEFLDIMKTFKTQQIDTPGVIRRVSNLFQGNKRLVLGFNTFLPEGYKIELPLDGDGPPVAVYRAPGQSSVTEHILGPNAPPVPAPPPAAQARPPQPQQPSPLRPPQPAQQPTQQPAQQPAQPPPPQQPVPPPPQRPIYGGQKPPPPAPYETKTNQPQPQPHSSNGPQPRMHAMPPLSSQAKPPQPQRPPAGPAPPQQPPPQQLPPQQPSPQAAQQPPVEFDHAINYVTTIKRRFASEPDTYKKFLEILHTYQKEQRGIKEVLDEVSVLFSEHPDLLKEFTYFLPDAVQAQAKQQLDQVAKESEARKRANASKQAIMEQAQGMQAHAQPPPRNRIGPTIPSPPQQPQQQQQQPQQQQQQPQQQPPFTQSPAPIPFGAAKGRSEEREREICRSALYGTVSYASVRPPRRSEPTPSQAALKNGRPQMIPELPTQQTTAESAFFERAKLHLNRKELAPDKPPGSRRHTPYTEFLKCLHLFGAGILNKEELVLLLRGLFMQGHAPKSGVNAGGGASNPAVANDAQELLREFEEVLVGRGHFADQERHNKDKSKYGNKQQRDFDFSGCEKPTPSYRSLPSDYPYNLFHSHSGQSGMDASVLNNTMVCVPARRGPRMVWSPEEYDGPSERNNVYEENMFKVEDERCEVDMAIERNVMAMRVVEPIAEEVTRVRETEEKDGQPIGRMHYKLRSRQLRCDQANAIARLYGDHGDEVLQHLLRNPVAVLPIVYQRLRQKDAEWRKAKGEMSKRWNAVYEANFLGSLDTTCWANKSDLEDCFEEKKIIKEVKNARNLAKEPGPLSLAPATAPFYPKFMARSEDPKTLIYQPHMRLPLGLNMPHKDAYQLVAKQVSMAKSNDEYQRITRIWAEMMCPLFQYPPHWILDELQVSSTGKRTSSIVKYSVGQKVVTAYGEGEILSVTEVTFQHGSSSLRYKVQLAFGTGYIQPEAILHIVPGTGHYVRMNGIMEHTELPSNGSDQMLDPKFSLLFGNQHAYCLLRVYCLLVRILADSKSLLDSQESSKAKVNSSDACEETQCDYNTVISALKKVLSNNISSLEFERVCRTASREKVAQMAILPKLVEKCANILGKIARGDTVLTLHDYTMMKITDPVKLRLLCLNVTENANYRIQLDLDAGWIYFSYLEPDQDLLVVPEYEEDETAGDALEEQSNNIGEDVDLETGEEDEEEVEDSEPDLPESKRQKLM